MTRNLTEEDIKNFIEKIEEKKNELLKLRKEKNALYTSFQSLNTVVNWVIENLEKLGSISTEEIFTNPNYLGKFFTWDSIYSNIKKEVTEIIEKDSSNRIFITGDLGTGKSMMTTMLIAYTLFNLSLKTNEEVAKTLNIASGKFGVLLDVSKPEKFRLTDLIKKLEEHFSNQSYNKFNWDDFDIYFETIGKTNYHPILVVRDSTLRSSSPNYSYDIFASRNRQNDICKYIEIQDLSDFTRVDLKEKEKYENDVQ